VRIVYKKIVVCISFVLFITAAYAQVGIGIWPNKLEVDIPAFKTVFSEIHLFNPTERSVDVQVGFYCKNCVAGVNLFGKSIGKLTYNLDVSVYPSMLRLEPSSSNKTYTVVLKACNPVFQSASLQIEFFGKKLTLPLLLTIFDKKSFNGMIVAETVDGSFNVQIASLIRMNFYGINTFLFMVAICLMALIIVFVYRERIRKEFIKYKL